MTNDSPRPPRTERQHPLKRVETVLTTSLRPEVLKLCTRAGLVKLGHVTLDGTKTELKANVSRHKAMSYKRMEEPWGRTRITARTDCPVQPRGEPGFALGAMFSPTK